MPTFKYEAINQCQNPITGSIEAENRDEVLVKVCAMGLFPIKIKEFERVGSKKYVADTDTTTYSHDLFSTKPKKKSKIILVLLGIGILIGILIGIAL